MPIKRSLTRSRKRGRPRTYPWDKWFSTDTSVTPLTITKGKEFHCQLLGMAQQIRQRAVDRGIQVSIRTENDDTLLITFHRL